METNIKVPVLLGGAVRTGGNSVVTIGNGGINLS